MTRVSGAKERAYSPKSLMSPIRARKELLDLSDDMAAKLNVHSYTDARDALLRGVLE